MIVFVVLQGPDLGLREDQFSYYMLEKTQEASMTSHSHNLLSPACQTDMQALQKSAGEVQGSDPIVE